MKKMKLHAVFLIVIFCLSFMHLFKTHTLPPACQSSCGNVQIVYPFGVSPGCYFAEDPSFKLTCEKDKLLFRNITIINISYIGELRVRLPRSYTCFDSQGNSTGVLNNKFDLGNFVFSNKTKLFTVGCDTIGILFNIEDGRYISGSMSFCNFLAEAKEGCSGNGCSQIMVPRGGQHLQLDAFSHFNHTFVQKFNPCSYAFLVEEGEFEFNPSEDLKNLRNLTDFPAVLSWSVGNKTCKQVGNASICAGKSRCIDSTTTNGYDCKCLEGLEGNPYVVHGCQDINECTSPIHKHNCSDHTCKDFDGGYTCKCRSGYRLDTTNMSCKRKEVEWATVILGIIIAFLVIVLGVSCIKQRIKHRKDSELRKKFFEQNGGGMLIQRVSGAGPSDFGVKIFTEQGMKEATNGYDESRILGQGGQGTVYKGILPDNSIVAIKKARLGDRSQVAQFINELLVLSQINHRNVVKLLGCCLETAVPLLVYEFINSGTLFDHLHGSLSDSSLTWEHRLRISIEVAGSLAYLHSSVSIPIIHRDIKSANILLDANLTAKVADFGISRQIPVDKDQMTTIVQGTLGYLDPDYHNTGLLNEKSDVYGFGIVLMELISGQRALSFDRPEASKQLVSYFGYAMNENRWQAIIDGQMIMADNQKEIQEAAKIAVECTRLMGEQRPRMKEVAAELEALTVKHKWSDKYPEKTDQYLLGGHSLSAQGDTSSRDDDSIKKELRLETEAAP